jgi:mannose-6-phosphate isomerase-like protein (cupin superfamily)
MNTAINLHAAAAALDEYWSQRTVGESNNNLFKVAKGVGSTNWHVHPTEDEVFVVLRGSLTIQLRDVDVVLSEGDLYIVPAGVEHCPTADDDVHLLLVGPSITSTAAGGKPAWSVV